MRLRSTSSTVLSASVLVLACADPVELAVPGRPPSFSVVGVPCDLSASATVRGDSVRARVERAARATTIELGACEYFVRALVRESHLSGDYNTGIWIERDSGLTIRGAGQGVTTVTFDSTVFIGFEVKDSVQDLLIEDMTIRGLQTTPGEVFTGPTGANAPTHGIGSRGTVAQAVSNVTIRRNEFRDLAVGVSVGTPTSFAGGAGQIKICTPGTYRTVRIEENYIHDMHGDLSGSGYGINNQCAEDVVISRNQIWRTERHAIYQAVTANDPTGTIMISQNLIVDHRHGRPYTGDIGALVICRSQKVSAVNNVIVGSHSGGLEVCYEGTTQTWLTTKIYVIGNRFLKPTSWDPTFDMWLYYGSGTVYLWGNTYNESVSLNSARVSRASGTDSPITPPGWDGTQSIECAPDGQLYVMNHGIFYKVTPDYWADPSREDPSSWRSIYQTSGWVNLEGVAVMQDSNDPHVYIFSGTTLTRLTPQSATGDWDPVSDTYIYSLGGNLGALGSAVFTIPNGSDLHRTVPQGTSGAWPYTTAGGWAYSRGIRGMIDGYLYISNEATGAIYRRNPGDMSAVDYIQ